MKIKTAIKELLSDAETSTASKIEVISFLRRYASMTRPCTHYSCRGKSTGAIVRLLETMGMKTGKDFSVAASSLDPEFNQIRWAKDAYSVSAMSTHLSAAMTLSGDSRVFDRLYARIVDRKPVDDLVEQFNDVIRGDADENDKKYINDENGKHFALAVLRRTKEIARAVMELYKTYMTAGGDASAMAVDMPPNFGLAIRAAAEYLDEHFPEGGSAATAKTTPYMLPLSVLELYCRVVKGSTWSEDGCFAAGDPGKKPPLLFKVSPGAMDLVRLMRTGDHLVWSPCLEAPLDYLWSCGDTDDGEKNPLHGYFFHDAKSVLNATLNDKVGVFVGGNAEMIHEEGADNNVTVAACVQNHDVFWTYVLALYARAYSCNAGMSCLSRIGVPASNLPDPSNSLTYAPFVVPHVKRWSEAHGFEGRLPMLAEYGVILSSNTVDPSFRSPVSFMRRNDHVRLVKITGESAMPDFGRQYLRKEELAWEWFAMTHLDHAAGKLGRDKVMYSAATRAAKEDTLIENLGRFKAIMASADKTDLAEMSRCTTGDGSMFLSKSDGYGSLEYTPLSAMFEGTCAVLRRAWQSGTPQTTPGIPIPIVGKKKTGTPRDSGVLVTNVYSGMCTNLSPDLGSPEDTGEVFPKMFASNGKTPYTEGVKSALTDSDARRAAVTRLLDRLNAGSMEQVSMAKRTTGTRRTAVMVFETNIDADAFLMGVNGAQLAVALGTVFMQTILLNHFTPACAINDAALEDTANCTCGRYADPVYRIAMSSGYFGALFESGWPSLPKGVYAPEEAWFKNMVNVATAKDADGRMVIVFRARGDILTYARLMYRYGCGFPLDTARTKELRYSSGENDCTVEVRDGEWGSLDTADKILCAYINKYCADKAGSGAVANVANGDCGPLFRNPLEAVPAGKAPGRDWYLHSRGSTISVDAAVYSYCEGDDSPLDNPF